MAEVSFCSSHQPQPLHEGFELVHDMLHRSKFSCTESDASAKHGELRLREISLIFSIARFRVCFHAGVW